MARRYIYIGSHVSDLISIKNNCNLLIRFEHIRKYNVNVKLKATFGTDF